MGNPKAFLNISRKEGGYRPKEERVKDYNEVEMRLNAVERREQASRCMECGVPFCHWSCPLGNRQPEWQDRLYKDDIEGAYALLSMTDDFPEFTGRVCPALCEKGCVLNKQHEAVTVRENELAIVERAFEASASDSAYGQTGGSDRLRTCRTRMCQSAQPSRTQCDRL